MFFQLVFAPLTLIGFITCFKFISKYWSQLTSQREKPKIPEWLLKGTFIPISFGNSLHVEDALVCPHCASTNISYAPQALRTVPEKLVEGVRVPFMCNSCSRFQYARNPALVLDIVTKEGKIYLQWEK